MDKMEAFIYSENGRSDKNVKKLLKVFSNYHPTTVRNCKSEIIELDNGAIIYRITFDFYIYEANKITDEERLHYLQRIYDLFLAESVYFNFMPLDRNRKPIKLYGQNGFSVRYYCDKTINENEIIKIANEAVRKLPFRFVKMSHHVSDSRNGEGKIIELIFEFIYFLSEEDCNNATQILCHHLFPNAESAGFRPLPKDEII